MTGRCTAEPFPARPPSPTWMRGPLPPPFADRPYARRWPLGANTAVRGPAPRAHAPGRPVSAPSAALRAPRDHHRRLKGLEAQPLPQRESLLPLPVDEALRQQSCCVLLKLPLSQLQEPVAVCMGERIDIFERAALMQWLISHHPRRRPNEAFNHPLTGERTAVCALRRIV